MEVKTKTQICHLKGDGEGFPIDSDGQFEAIVSVFGVPDSVKDIVMPGAFSDSLNAWAERNTKFGNNIPILWSHRMDDPRYNIGYVLSASEVGPADERIPKSATPEVQANGGLWIKGQLDIDSAASDIALQARKLLQQRRVVQFSFAYDIQKAIPNEDGYLELHKLWLHEVSPTQVGAHQMTDLGYAKSNPDSAPGERESQTVDAGHPSLTVARLRCDAAALMYGHL